MSSPQHDTVSMFNHTFQFCINSLLDDRLLVVKHAFQAGLVYTRYLSIFRFPNSYPLIPCFSVQTMSVMLISISKCDRFLSVSDIVTYICEFDQFDKYFEIIDERISNTMLSMKDMDCKLAALEFTLSIMTVSPNNIHSNVFTEHLLSNQFHRILFKYLKYQMRGIHEQYVAEQHRQQSKPEIITEDEVTLNDDDKVEETKEDKSNEGEEEEFILQRLKEKQDLLMLILCNIVTLSHYQRFESENVALKWLGGMKAQPTKVSGVIP